MTLDTAKLTQLLNSIAQFSAALKTQLGTKLGKTEQAVDSKLLEGKSLAEIQTLINTYSDAQLKQVSDALAAFIARRDNPNQVTKAQVGLGLVDNFATATGADAVAGTAANLFLTPAALASFWADKVGTAPETLDTIQEIANALHNNPDIIDALTKVSDDNKVAINELTATVAANKTAAEKADSDAAAKVVTDIAAALAEAKAYADTGLATKLDATATAVNSDKLGGKTLAEIQGQFEAGLVRATKEEALAGTDTSKLMTPATTKAVADKVAADAAAALAPVSAQADKGVTDAAAAQSQADKAVAAAATAQTQADKGVADAAAALAAAQAAQTTADGKLGKTEQAVDSAKLGGKSITDLTATNSDVATGTATDKFVTPASLKSKTDAQDLIIAANQQSTEDLVNSLIKAFNDASDDMSK